MRTTFKAFALLMALAIVAYWATDVVAFHDGGVADCAGCHTMHNSQGGVAVAEGGSPGQGVNPFLLMASTASDTCLRCHAGDGGGYHVFATDSMAPTNERGAGDFVFLTEDNVNDGHAGASNPILGESAGHSIVAPAFGLAADSVLSTAPGGTFQSQNLGCASCHDPHGTGAFRMLYSNDRAGFTAPAPEADSLHVFAGGVERNDNHTAYKSGMSAWCGNCHGDFHNNAAAFIHPSGVPLGAIAATYNAYNGTTDCVNNPGGPGGAPCGTGSQDTAYLAAVPFEDASMTTGSTSGPTASSRVMCLSCHRAHATSAADAGRWDFSVTLLDEDGLESGSWVMPNPYDANQRSLCNKCHAQDAYDHISELGGE